MSRNRNRVRVTALMRPAVGRARDVTWRNAPRVATSVGIVVTMPVGRMNRGVARLACAIAAQATEETRRYGVAARVARREAARAERDALAMLARAEHVAALAPAYAVAGRSAEHGASLLLAVRNAQAAAATLDRARAVLEAAQAAHDAWRAWVVMPSGDDPYAYPSDAAIRRARRATRTRSVGVTVPSGAREIALSGDLMMLPAESLDELLPVAFPSNVAYYVDGQLIPSEWATRFAAFGCPMAVARATPIATRIAWDADNTRAVIDAIRRECVKAAGLPARKGSSPGEVDPRTATDRRERLRKMRARKRARLSAMNDAMSRLSVLYATA